MSWRKSYDLTLALHVEAVEAAHVVGLGEEMERLASIVMKEAGTVLDKASVYEVKMLAHYSQQNYQRAIEVGLEALNLLGVRFPKNPSKFRVLLGIWRTKSVLAGKKIEDLLNLPVMTDPAALASMRILTNIGVSIYTAAPTLYPFLAFNQVRLSVKHGASPHSTMGYAGFGMILMSAFGDIDAAYRFGQFAEKLVDLLDFKEIKPKSLLFFNCFSRHWKEHIRNSLPGFAQAHQTGLETGDLEYAALGCILQCVFSFCMGKELAGLEQELDRNNDAITQMKQEPRLGTGLRLKQLVLNLTGRSDDPKRLTGEISLLRIKL
jgi:predicted ATPase